MKNFNQGLKTDKMRSNTFHKAKMGQKLQSQYYVILVSAEKTNFKKKIWEMIIWSLLYVIRYKINLKKRVYMGQILIQGVKNWKNSSFSTF